MNSLLRQSFVVMLLLLTRSNATAGIVYQNDFETDTTGFTTLGRIGLPTDGSSFGSPTASSMFLGSFATGSTTLNLSGLTPGGTYALQFDLFIGSSMDGNTVFPGNPTFGPDRWSLTADATTLVDTTFSNLVVTDGTPVPEPANAFTQSYSDSHVIGYGEFAAYTGADVQRDDTVEVNYLNRYSIYYFGHGAGNPLLQFTATGSTLALVFTGTNLQAVGDEFWAIDNVMVTDASISAVPEPTSLTLFGLGSLGLAVGRRRRRSNVDLA